MPLYQLTTNERTIYVQGSEDRIRYEMMMYTKKKLKEGMKLADVLFFWSPITVHRLSDVFKEEEPV